MAYRNTDFWLNIAIVVIGKMIPDHDRDRRSWDFQSMILSDRRSWFGKMIVSDRRSQKKVSCLTLAYILIFETYFFLISNILEIKCGWLHTYLVEFQITAELVNDEVNSIKLQISLNGNIFHHRNIIPVFPTVCSANPHQ